MTMDPYTEAHRVSWSVTSLQAAADQLRMIMLTSLQLGSSDSFDLAAELARHIRYSAVANTDALLDALNRCLPRLSPHWDEVDALLAAGLSTEEVLARLIRQGRDPIETLIHFMDEVAPAGSPPTRAGEHQRVVEILLETATLRGVSFVLARLELLGMEHAPRVQSLIRARAESITLATVALWPSLSWNQRFQLGLIFDEYELPSAHLCELLLEELPAKEDYCARLNHVVLLSWSTDPRVRPCIHQIFDEALSALFANRSADAEAFVVSLLGVIGKTQFHPTEAQLALAAQCGIR